MMTAVEVVGRVAPGFEAVAEAVAEVGAGVEVAALVAGEPVIDVRTADLPDRALVCTWSAIKPVTGACLLLLVEQGRVGLDQPVVEVWPEIKDERLLVRHVLTHTAGRVTRPDVPLTDWDGFVTALAEAEPDWPPGEVLCEHAFTFGHLVGEIVRRVDGRRLRQFMAEELTEPLDLDIQIGVKPEDRHRAAQSVGVEPGWWADQGGEPGSARERARGEYVDVNSDDWMSAEAPAVNGFATARGLAGFWQAFLDGRLPAGVGEVGASGFDLFVEEDRMWTLAGGFIDGPDVGMGGLGGQWAAARPKDALAWALLTSHVGDFDRADRVERALLAALS